MVYTYEFTRGLELATQSRDAILWDYGQKRYWRGRSHGKEISDACLTRTNARRFGETTDGSQAFE